MDEKDRLGDKLRQKEKAAEDLYIAEQERKKLEKLRQAAGAATATGACPRDGTTLVPHKENGVTIDICPKCQGIWLDKGEMQIAVKGENEAAVIRWVRSIFAS